MSAGDIEVGPDLAAQKLHALTQLIAGVAHEINNPLTSVQGLASLLLADARDQESREDLEIVVAEVTRAVRIVQNLRAFAGRTGDQPRPVSLGPLVENVLDARGYETRARGIQLSMRAAEGLPPVTAVPADVLFLVLMLLLRAEQAIGAGRSGSGPAPSISLALAADERGVVLTVEHDADRATEASSDATLTACAAAAAEMGGSLDEEALPAGGSRVTITLPAAT